MSLLHMVLQCIILFNYLNSVSLATHWEKLNYNMLLRVLHDFALCCIILSTVVVGFSFLILLCCFILQALTKLARI